MRLFSSSHVFDSGLRGQRDCRTTSSSRDASMTKLDSAARHARAGLSFRFALSYRRSDLFDSITLQNNRK